MAVKNYIPNPGFHVDADGWTARGPNNSSMTWVAGAGRFGSPAVLVTTGDATSTYINDQYAISIDAETFEAGYVTASAWIRTDEVNTSVSVAIQWFDAGGAAIEYEDGAEAAPVAGGDFIRVSHTSPIPDGAVFFRVRPNMAVNGGGLGGEQWYVDSVLATAGTELFDYFDGDSPATLDFVHEWEGTPYASASIRRAVKTTDEIVVARNLMINGAFKAPISNWFAGKVTLDVEEFEGANALRIAGDRDSEDSFTRPAFPNFSELGELEPGKTYTASATAHLPAPLIGTDEDTDSRARRIVTFIARDGQPTLTNVGSRVPNGNKILNPSFEDGIEPHFVAGAPVNSYSLVGVPEEGTVALQINTNPIGSEITVFEFNGWDGVIEQHARVSPNQEWLGGVRLRRGNGTGEAKLTLFWFNAENDYLGATHGPWASLTTVYQDFTAQGTSPDGAAFVVPAVRVRNASGNPSGGGVAVLIDSGTLAPTSGSTERVSTTFTIPHDALGMEIRLYNGASLGNGDILWQNVMLNEGDRPLPYFDGDSPGARWVGAPHDSVSELVALSEPEVVVEVAWTDNYSETDPEWTDISEYVEGFDTSMGRSREIGAIETGTVNLRLDNSEGAFTPGNVNSPFYPNVKPRRQVRIRMADAEQVQRRRLENLVIDPLPKETAWGYSAPAGSQLLMYSASGVTNYSVEGYPSRVDTAIENPITGEGFPCSNGDFLSAYCEAFGIQPSGDFVGQLGLVIEVLNSAGAVVQTSTFSGVTPATDADGVGDDLHAPLGLANFEVNATAAASFRVLLSLRPTSGRVLALCSINHAAYNHGATAFDWDAGVAFVSGDTDYQDWRSYWTGARHRSTSVAISPPTNATGFIARGIIEEWPAVFSGLSPETVVPISDWLGPLSAREIDIAYVNELERYAPLALFRLDEDRSVKRRPASRNPEYEARVTPSWDPDIWPQYYDGTTKRVPTLVQNDDIDLLSTNPEVKAPFPRFQNSRPRPGGGHYLNGASLRMNIPPVTFGDESFSLTWIYHLAGLWPAPGFDTTGPIIIVLRESNGQAAMWLRLKPSADPEVFQLWVTGFSKDGVYSEGDNPLASIATGINKHMVLSWDGSDDAFRLVFRDDSVGGLVDFPSSPYTTPNDGDLRSFYEGAIFDEVMFLGWGAPYNEGYANHGVSMVSIHDQPLFPRDVQILEEVAEGRVNDSLADRVHAVLDAMGWSRDLRDIDDSPMSLSVANWPQGTSGVEVIRDVTESTVSNLYVDEIGQVTVRTSHGRVKTTEPDWVFDLNSDTGIEAGLAFRCSQDDLTNEVRLVTDGNGDTYLRRDESVEEYGLCQEEIKAGMADPEDARQYGYHRLNRYSQPIIRAEAVTFRPSASAWGSMWATAKGIRFGDRVRITGLPATAPADSMDFFVESVSHSVTRIGERLDWLVTLDISPARISEGWVLGQGRLGHTTRLHV